MAMFATRRMALLAGTLAALVITGCGGTGQQQAASEESEGPTTAAAVTLNPSDTYVNLFKWRWKDIATECTSFLGPQGFGAVQISPPAEHKNVNYWWNIYQPVNHHNLTSDMGTPAELQTMIDTCHAAGVRVYADVVFNQMSADSGTGVGGSSFNASTFTYPYFGSSDFHSYCTIDYSSASNTASCWLLGMPDLNTGSSYVQGQFVAYLDSLIAMGVDGFRIDAAKHILPSELQTILAAATQTTLLGESVFVTHEVIEDQSWIDLAAYQASGTVNEFRFTRAVRDAFRNNALGSVTTYMGTGSGGGTYSLITTSAKATVFVNNHDTERATSDSLNYTSDSGGKYDLANIYMLAQPYGRAQLQSGYAFSYSNTDENAPTGSPYDSSGNPVITTTCSNTSTACGWDFVHRWSTISPMVKFRSAASGTAMTVRSTGNGNQLAFSRGSVGFVALNNDSSSSWTATFATGLPAGTYCNVVHGVLSSAGTACASDSVTVDSSGNATITVPVRGGSSISAVAIYTGQKVGAVTTAPDAPTGVTATAASSSAINLSWTASSGAASYTVYRSTSASSGFAALGTTTSTSYASTGLSSATTYYYYVTATNSVGTSGASSTVSATTSLYSANYGAMYLRGSMNSWGATAMSLTANNLWSTSVTLTAGTTYTYKYENRRRHHLVHELGPRLQLHHQPHLRHRLGQRLQHLLHRHHLRRPRLHLQRQHAGLHGLRAVQRPVGPDRRERGHRLLVQPDRLLDRLQRRHLLHRLPLDLGLRDLLERRHRDVRQLHRHRPGREHHVLLLRDRDQFGRHLQRLEHRLGHHQRHGHRAQRAHRRLGRDRLLVQPDGLPGPPPAAPPRTPSTARPRPPGPSRAPARRPAPRSPTPA
ncbi:MAG: alpha-amylase family glycosyl hydrolase [Anaeromyxobacter sp.]